MLSENMEKSNGTPMRRRKPPFLVERPQKLTKPTLQFTPAAWLKLQFFCHLGSTEVGGFGVVSDPTELIVAEVVTPQQHCSPVSVRFDDQAVADYFDDMVDRGLAPERFGRVWLHTHPGDSAQPSCTDEETFARVFGKCDWAIMFILARGGATCARLRFSVGPGGELPIPVGVSWGLGPGQIDEVQWRAEYKANVTVEDLSLPDLLCDRGQRFDLGQDIEQEAQADEAEDPFDAWDAMVDEMEDEYGLYGF